MELYGLTAGLLEFPHIKSGVRVPEIEPGTVHAGGGIKPNDDELSLQRMTHTVLAGSPERCPLLIWEGF